MSNPAVAFLVGVFMGVCAVVPDMIAYRRAKQKLRDQCEVMEKSSDFAINLAEELVAKKKEFESLMAARN